MTVPAASSRVLDDEQVDVGSGGDLKPRATTSAPVYSTLPESGGNADLDIPTSKAASRAPKSVATQSAGQDPAATSASETADYVTAPSISKNSFDQQQPQARQLGRPGYAFDHLQRLGDNQTASSREESHDVDSNRVNYFKDLNSSPVPLSSGSSTTNRPPLDQQQQEQQESHSKAESRSALR